jgi:signal recognition particle receptor subunit beta
MSPAPSSHEVTARIVYWGAAGAGKSTSLRTIHAKLKADHRGDFQELPTRLDPTVTYETFSIQLGSISGMKTRLQVLAVPGGPGLEATRKQLLDRVDGVVLVLDSQADRLDANLESLDELRKTLTDYGDSFNQIPLVVQYNKRDLGDPFAIEELHRRLNLDDAAVFETVATEGSGILQSLTTISKRVVRVMRERGLEPEPIAPTRGAESAPAPARVPSPLAEAPAENLRTHTIMEEAILSEGRDRAAHSADAVTDAQIALDRPWPALRSEAKAGHGARIGADLKIVSIGQTCRTGDRAVRIPLVLGNDDGETVTLSLTIQLDPLLDEHQT